MIKEEVRLRVVSPDDPETPRRDRGEEESEDRSVDDEGSPFFERSVRGTDADWGSRPSREGHEESAGNPPSTRQGTNGSTGGRGSNRTATSTEASASDGAAPTTTMPSRSGTTAAAAASTSSPAAAADGAAASSSSGWWAGVTSLGKQVADLASSSSVWVKQSWGQQADPRAAPASSSYAEPLLFTEESDQPQLTEETSRWFPARVDSTQESLQDEPVMITERENSLYMDAWQPFQDNHVSLPAFLVQQQQQQQTLRSSMEGGGSPAVRNPFRRWFNRGSRGSTDASSSSSSAARQHQSRGHLPTQLEEGTDLASRPAVFLSRTGMHGDRFHQVPGLTAAEASDQAPQLGLMYNPGELNRAYVMRPLRMVMWLVLLVTGYFMTAVWCSFGLPKECRDISRVSPADIAVDLAAMLQMGFATGWFARVTHPKRFAWLIAKENLWFFIVFFGLPPTIGFVSNLPAFNPAFYDVGDWSNTLTTAVVCVAGAALASVLWHMWQAFRRSFLVGAVFSCTRLVILIFYAAEVLSTWSSLPGGGITRLKHFRPYFLIWWTSLFSEYNHVMSDATLGIGAACLVQGMGAYSFSHHHI